jgi:aspartyl-tRNA(Asn)/glutamyl-tRNA(Gln) amidotransferase subunit A
MSTPTPQATDLADCTATELLQLYRTQQASPLEATESVLARIAKVDPALNAFCVVDPDAARAAARASTERWRKGAPQDLLDGVPVSIKDLILTKGWPTLRGSRTIDPKQPWDVDAPSVARLRDAGAVLVGKTTTPEFGIKGTTDNTLTGVTRNPWNPQMTPGGSSGGACAAVASGMGPLAIGTDGAGSIRIPSAFCGIPGIKPSFGRVPAFPLSPMGTVAHIGPHARSVEDLALALTVLSRPDARDWTSLPYDPRDYRVGLNDGVRGLRVAFSPDLGYVKNVDPEVAAAVRRAADAFAALGAHVEEV